MEDIKTLDTEKRNSKSMNLSSMNAKEIVSIINSEDHLVAEAISKKLEDISNVVEMAAKTISEGGRIIYLGAGTSGRLGVLDAVECPPTFGVDPGLFVGLIAGGENAFVKAIEGAEDSKEGAIKDLKDINFSNKDLLIGIAASGRTPYVIGGIEYAKEIGAKTVSLATTSNSKIGELVDQKIEIVLGAEVLTGSTRMKSGSAQKMVLNMISTGAMILNGKVYQNLMVDVMQTNKKLEIRARNIVVEATGCSEQKAKEMLEVADNSVKLAIVMIINDCSKEEAKDHLEKNKGFI